MGPFCDPVRGGAVTYWTPTDCLPDRMVLVLEAGTVSLDETCEVLRAHDWPAPSLVSVPGDDGHLDDFPAAAGPRRSARRTSITG